MIHNNVHAMGGGFKVLLEEALPTCTSSTAIFANAPRGSLATTVTTGASSATQTVGSTAGWKVGDTIYFNTTASERIISSITSSTVVVFTATISTTTGETASNTTAGRGTMAVSLTVRAQTVTMRFDGNAATVGANGHDFGVQTAPYDIPLTQAQLANVRAISPATATGWITYYGLP